MAAEAKIDGGRSFAHLSERSQMPGPECEGQEEGPGGYAHQFLPA